jgi:uncharacterized protein YqeY
MLEEKLNQDYVQAMKSKEALKVSTVNFLRAQLKNVRIDQRKEKLSDEEVVVVIKKQMKQRQDSIEQYEKGGRPDLADKEKQELAILKSYLPQEMPEAELRRIVEEAVKQTNASSMKDMGNVMKIVTAKAAGRADNRAVSELVKKVLSSG